ncbi:hypothetical protein [Methylobacterium sp. 17Sr1-1]|uniref:hypothetical protein n=1 Tax=Methylobacterium sp. 17Sr1-1 TaxID=2202826 RepID=UPI001FE13CEB|nr:hypothetical protein [Methylobacterium sp. 17Sr1-1]
MAVGQADIMAKDGGVAEDVTTVGFMLVEQSSMIAASSAIESLRLANRAARRELYRYSLWSETGQSCTASNGVEVRVAGSLGEAPPLAMAIVCRLRRHRHPPPRPPGAPGGLAPQRDPRRGARGGLHRHLRARQGGAPRRRPGDDPLGEPGEPRLRA